MRMDMSAFAHISYTGNTGTTTDWMQFGPCYRLRTNGGSWTGWEIAPGGGWVDKLVSGPNYMGSTSVMSMVNGDTPHGIGYDGKLSGDMDLQVGCRFTFYGRQSGTISTLNMVVAARIYNF
jgi:hypothetical protein